jgi:hypothetical protein
MTEYLKVCKGIIGRSTFSFLHRSDSLEINHSSALLSFANTLMTDGQLTAFRSSLLLAISFSFSSFDKPARLTLTGVDGLLSDVGCEFASCQSDSFAVPHSSAMAAGDGTEALAAGGGCFARTGLGATIVVGCLGFVMLTFESEGTGSAQGSSDGK